MLLEGLITTIGPKVLFIKVEVVILGSEELEELSKGVEALLAGADVLLR